MTAATPILDAGPEALLKTIGQHIDAIVALVDEFDRLDDSTDPIAQEARRLGIDARTAARYAAAITEQAATTCGYLRRANTEAHNARHTMKRLLDATVEAGKGRH